MKRFSVLIPAVVMVGGCGTVQSALAGDGADGANFASLFAIFLAVCTLMYLLVMGGLAMALWRRRSAEQELTVEGERHAAEPPGAIRLLAAWGILILAGLVALTVASFFTDRSNARAAEHPGLSIHVTGNQWWWDVQYDGATPSQGFRTANEIHIPVGIPVEVVLRSNDVIHSLWIPNLAGKQDLIPGRDTDLQLRARRAGHYRGECAEFCGVQHAHMALDVIAQSPADFRRWAAAQVQDAAPPAGDAERAGYALFVGAQCASCHAIGGSPAGATVGPDLTHLASRPTIAAGTLPMTPANLKRWIADPQGVKPGTNMPRIRMTELQLEALTAYLKGLR